MPKPKTMEAESSPALKSARLVIEKEIEGLHALITALDEKFVQAVDLIFGLKGRLIISGMGKSGHIARKIAATCASTGTPALFVHPSEASHGDLGMITENDAVMLLSNSGETAEMRDLISYTRRFSIPLIGVARNPQSTLIVESDIGIALPAIAEASPTGAPTTSTAMMLALGDAIAIALLERRGFTPEKFHVFHPGGKLGKQLLRVGEVMHSLAETPLVSATDPMQKVLLTMTEKGFGCTGVINAAGELIGIVTDGDLRRHMDNQLLSRTAQDIMTASPVTSCPEDLAAEALAQMSKRKVQCLLVVSERKPAGIIRMHDCVRAGVV